MQLIPLGDRVIIKEDNQEEKTGLFYIPETYRKNTNQGVVTAIGPGIDGQKINVSVGDRVLFQKNTGQRYELGTEIVTVLDEMDIICIVRE